LQIGLVFFLLNIGASADENCQQTLEDWCLKKGLIRLERVLEGQGHAKSDPKDKTLEEMSHDEYRCCRMGMKGEEK